MRPFLIVAWLFLCHATVVSAQKLRPDAATSKISFSIKNLGFNTTGHFKQIEGIIEFSASNANQAKFDIRIPTSSIDTDNNLRDKHLKKEEYFDVEKYPQMHFVSSKVTMTTPGKYKITGNLSIKGVEKTIQFDFDAVSTEKGYSFTGTFPLNRRDFGVGGKSLSMSDHLTVQLLVNAIK